MKNNCDDVTCESNGSCLEMELLQIDHQTQIYDLLELNTSSLVQVSSTQPGNSDLFNASSSPQNSANFSSLETQVLTQATDIWTTPSERCTDPALQNSSVTGGESHVIGDFGFPLQSYKASSDWQGGTFIPPATCSEESVGIHWKKLFYSDKSVENLTVCNILVITFGLMFYALIGFFIWYNNERMGKPGFTLSQIPFHVGL